MVPYLQTKPFYGQPNLKKILYTKIRTFWIAYVVPARKHSTFQKDIHEKLELSFTFRHCTQNNSVSISWLLTPILRGSIIFKTLYRTFHSHFPSNPKPLSKCINISHKAIPLIWLVQSWILMILFILIVWEKRKKTSKQKRN